MHNTGAHFAADAAEAVQMIKERVHQRAVVVARRRMHHHAAGLDHHRQVFILIENIQRNILGFRFCGLDLRQGDDDGNAGFCLI